MTDIDNFELRILTGEDASSYKRVRLRALQEHPEAFGRSYEFEEDRSLEEIAQSLEMQPQRTTMGAFIDGEMVGMIGIGQDVANAKTRHRSHLGGMYVVAEHQGKKIGRALLEAALSNLRAREDVMIVLIAVTVGNLGARHLYRSAGFSTWGVEPAYIHIDGRFYDIEWMSLMF